MKSTTYLAFALILLTSSVSQADSEGFESGLHYRVQVFGDVSHIDLEGTLSYDKDQLTHARYSPLASRIDDLLDGLPNNTKTIRVTLGSITGSDVFMARVIGEKLRDRCSSGLLSHRRWWSNIEPCNVEVVATNESVCSTACLVLLLSGDIRKADGVVQFELNTEDEVPDLMKFAFVTSLVITEAGANQDWVSGLYTHGVFENAAPGTFFSTNMPDSEIFGE